MVAQQREVTPGRFLRGWKGYSRTAALYHLPVGFHNSASPVRSERAVAARLSLALQQSSTREMPVRRKGDGPETTLLRDEGKTVDDYEKESKRNNVSLVSRV